MTREDVIQAKTRTWYTSLRDETQASQRVLDQFSEYTVRVNAIIAALATLGDQRSMLDHNLLQRYGNDYDEARLSHHERSLIREINARSLQLAIELEDAHDACSAAYWRALLTPDKLAPSI